MILVILLIFLCSLGESYTVVVPMIQQQQRNQQLIRSRYCAQQHLSSFVNNDHDDYDSTTVNDIQLEEIEKEVARQLKIVICSGSACTRARQSVSVSASVLLQQYLERYHLMDILPIEETYSCLGSCTMSPCIGMEHEEYDGTVALLGMTSIEFQQRVFHTVMNINDIDRIWDIILDSIRTMAAAAAAVAAAADTTGTTMDSDDDDDDDENDHHDIYDHPNAV